MVSKFTVGLFFFNLSVIQPPVDIFHKKKDSHSSRYVLQHAFPRFWCTKSFSRWTEDHVTAFFTNAYSCNFFLSITFSISYKINSFCRRSRLYFIRSNFSFRPFSPVRKSSRISKRTANASRSILVIGVNRSAAMDLLANKRLDPERIAFRYSVDVDETSPRSKLTWFPFCCITLIGRLQEIEMQRCTICMFLETKTAPHSIYDRFLRVSTQLLAFHYETDYPIPL